MDLESKQDIINYLHSTIWMTVIAKIVVKEGPKLYDDILQVIDATRNTIIDDIDSVEATDEHRQKTKLQYLSVVDHTRDLLIQAKAMFDKNDE